MLAKGRHPFPGQPQHQPTQPVSLENSLSLFSAADPGNQTLSPPVELKKPNPPPVCPPTPSPRGGGATSLKKKPDPPLLPLSNPTLTRSCPPPLPKAHPQPTPTLSPAGPRSPGVCRRRPSGSCAAAGVGWGSCPGASGFGAPPTARVAGHGWSCGGHCWNPGMVWRQPRRGGNAPHACMRLRKNLMFSFFGK